MNKSILTLLFLFNLSFCLSQNVFFDRHYEFGTWTRGSSLISLCDTSFIVAGTNDILTNGLDNYSAILVKTDTFGDTIRSEQFLTTDTIFQNLFNANSDDFFYSIVRTPDSNLMVIGSTQSYGATNLYDFDLYLVKLDNNLDTLWTKAISHPNDTAFRPNQIINTSDGGFLICGWQNSFTSPNVRAFLCKVDSTGNVLWRKSYENLYYTSTFWSVVETADHSFICSGTVFDLSFDGYASLIKVDSTGNFIQTLYSDTQSKTFGSKIISTSDGNYLWTSIRSDGNTNFTNNFVKLNETGTVIWNISYCLYREGGPMSILQNPDGTFMMAGANGIPNQSGLTQGILMKIDSNGDSLWTRLFQMPTQHGWFHDLDNCSDGGYIICGETYCCNFTPGVGNTSSMWLVRTDSLGLFTGFDELADVNPDIILGLPYPNPSSDYFEIVFTFPDNPLPYKGIKGIELMLFDYTGKQIASKTPSPDTNKVRFEMTGYAAGTYIAVLSIDGYNAGNRKIVKH